MMAPRKKTPGRDTYETGYGRPPKQHQFQKGMINNPNGRAGKNGKGKREPEFLAEIIREVANKEMWVTTDGKRKRMNSLAVAVNQIFADAMSKGPKARADFLALLKMSPELLERPLTPITGVELEMIEPPSIRSKRIWRELEEAHPEGIPEQDREVLKKYFPATEDDGF